MSQQSNILLLAKWEFVSAKKRGMVKMVFWREPVRIDGRTRTIVPQAYAYAWHQQNRRRKLAVYRPDLEWAKMKGFTGWRVQGVNSVEALTPEAYAAAVGSTM